MKPEKDLAEVPDNVKSGLEIIPVSTVDEVLKLALTGPLTPIQWTEEDEAASVAAAAKPAGDDLAGGLVTH